MSPITPRTARGLALGLYATCYYLGGSVGGALPAVFWDAGGWPACVAFLIVVEMTMLTIAWRFWTDSRLRAALARLSAVLARASREVRA